MPYVFEFKCALLLKQTHTVKNEHVRALSLIQKRVRLCWMHLLQELAELPAFGISGAEILFRSHHCADATPICILSRAVHLPPFLWPDGLHRDTCSHKYTAHISTDVQLMSWLWHRSTQLLCFVILFIIGHPFFCLLPQSCNTNQFHWLRKSRCFEKTKCFCCKIFLCSLCMVSSEFPLQQ